MNYTQKLTMSMVVPTIMVAGAGSAVVVGALWLKNQAITSDATTLSGYLEIGSSLTAVLTAICVAVCIGFTLWIRRTAHAVLGGEPSDASLALAELASGNLKQRLPNAPEGSLMHSLTRLMSMLQSTIGQIQNSVHSISGAASEIASGNQDLSTRTEHTAGNLQRTASMDEIVSSVQRVGDMVSQITAASIEQSREIGEVNASVGELDQMTQQNAALVEQSAAAAESLKEQSTRLAHAVAVFQTDGLLS